MPPGPQWLSRRKASTSRRRFCGQSRSNTKSFPRPWRPPGPPGHTKKRRKKWCGRRRHDQFDSLLVFMYLYSTCMQYTCRCKCCSYTHAPVVPKDPQSLWLTSRYVFSSSFFSNFLLWDLWSYNPRKKWPYKCVTGVTTLLIGLITPCIPGKKSGPFSVSISRRSGPR